MVLKKFPFVISNGFSKTVKRRWWWLRKFFFGNRKKNFPYIKFVELRINFPPDEIWISFHPNIKQRLVNDFGYPRLSLLNCSTGNFGKALKEDRIGLGHVWAEIYTIILATIIERLGFEHIYFGEKFNLIKENGGYVVYRIRIMMSQPFPYELVSGLEHLVNGYMNALAMDRDFDVHARINEYINYRRGYT